MFRHRVPVIFRHCHERHARLLVYFPVRLLARLGAVEITTAAEAVGQFYGKGLGEAVRAEANERWGLGSALHTLDAECAAFNNPLPQLAIFTAYLGDGVVEDGSEGLNQYFRLTQLAAIGAVQRHRTIRVVHSVVALDDSPIVQRLLECGIYGLGGFVTPEYHRRCCTGSLLDRVPSCLHWPSQSVWRPCAAR